MSGDGIHEWSAESTSETRILATPLRDTERDAKGDLQWGPNFPTGDTLGEFIHTHSDVKFPAGGGKKIYSCNEGNSPNWDLPILDYINWCKENKYAARYVGSMVSDVHRTILYGGIFVYPAG
mgnify:CR=1 FL=1